MEYTITIASENWKEPVAVEFRTLSGGGHNTTVRTAGGASASTRTESISEAVRWALRKVHGEQPPF